MPRQFSLQAHEAGDVGLPSQLQQQLGAIVALCYKHCSHEGNPLMTANALMRKMQIFVAAGENSNLQCKHSRNISPFRVLEAEPIFAGCLSQIAATLIYMKPTQVKCVCFISKTYLRHVMLMKTAMMMRAIYREASATFEGFCETLDQHAAARQTPSIPTRKMC
jgi:hypothetical protein